MFLYLIVFCNCNHWCESPCFDLNGPYYEECSSCLGSSFMCRPGSSTFHFCHESSSFSLKMNRPVVMRNVTTGSIIWNGTKKDFLNNAGGIMYDPISLEREISFSPHYVDLAKSKNLTLLDIVQTHNEFDRKNLPQGSSNS